MTVKRAFLFVVAGGFIGALTCSAQFIKWGTDKMVKIDISRPPQFGLTVKRVAFGQPGGSCAADAAQLVDQMILPDFQQNQMDVVERAALDQIMAEHNFSKSEYADPSSAAKLGKILGPSALIIVNVNGCHPDQTPLVNRNRNEFSGQVTVTYISKTRYSLEGSVRVVDLTTGQVLGSHNFESKPEKQNENGDGQPEYPPVDEVKDEALQAVKAQVHAMFFPYDETRGVLFYDDKDCGLKQEYELFHNGDKDGSLRMADSNVEQCKSGHKKDKSLTRAYYDAGLLHCVRGDYDKAQEFFTGAMDGKGAEAVAGTSALCNQKREGATALATYEVQFAKIPVPAPIASAVAKNIPQESPMDSKVKSGAEPAPPSTPTAVSPEERLKRLDSALKKGLITKKEYDEKRAEILKEM